jgi:hypothetical protein
MAGNKKGEFNFVWIFAIIAGAAILILAIYGALRLGDTSRYEADTEVAKKIEILTNPLQAGFAEGSFGKITFTSKTRINNYCYGDELGKSVISVSTHSRVGEEWKPAGGEISIHNKYIFSELAGDGAEEYYVFSKPFEFPFKVSDLVFLIDSNDKYCFVSPPQEVEDEILGLNIPNIDVNNCTDTDGDYEDVIEICFGSSNCDISVYGDNVYYDTGRVIKNDGVYEFAGSLMYGAIFSDNEIYECNVERLMHRVAEISGQYIEKGNLMDGRGCNTNLQPDLYLLQAMTVNATSEDLSSLYVLTQQINEKNERELCGVW